MQGEQNPEKNNPVSFKRWKSIVYKNREKLGQSLVQGITRLLEEVDRKKINAVSLHIIYTRTGICNKRPYYRIYLFDERLYNGNTDCWTYWEMPELINYAESMFPIMEGSCQLGYKPPEEIMEQKRLKCAENLYIIMGEMIACFLHYVFEQLPQINCYSVFFGEYMNEQRLLFKPGELKKIQRYKRD